MQKQVHCDICKTYIRMGDTYYHTVTGQNLCEICDKQHGLDWRETDICIRGTSDWWEVPTTQTYGVSPYEEGYYGDLQYQYEQEVPRIPRKEVAVNKEPAPVGISVWKGSPSIKMTDIEVFFTQETFNQVFAYVDSTGIEISGIGRVKREVVGNKIYFTVHEVFLLPQRNTSTTTHLDPEELSKFLIKRVQDNLPVKDIKLWWHSHVNMAAFWSGTDNACCDAFALEGQETENWFLSIVVNKSRELRCRLDIYKPERVIVDDLPVKVMLSFSEPQKGLYEAEVKEKCKESGWGNYTNYNFRKEEKEGLTEQQIIFSYANNKASDLRYYNDMSDMGKQIENLHYNFEDLLYAAFEDNKEAPDHKVAHIKSMRKGRDWYIDKNGSMCKKQDTRIIRPKELVQEEQRLLFFKRLDGCQCAWCRKQLEIIGQVQATVDALPKKGDADAGK